METFHRRFQGEKKAGAWSEEEDLEDSVFLRIWELEAVEEGLELLGSITCVV